MQKDILGNVKNLRMVDLEPRQFFLKARINVHRAAVIIKSAAVATVNSKRRNLFQISAYQGRGSECLLDRKCARLICAAIGSQS